MSCEQALKGHALLTGAVRQGLSALAKTDRKRLTLQDTRRCGGSANLDAHLQRRYPRDNRWDYAIDYAGYCHFVEVHPATAGEIKVMLAKLRWLEDLIDGDEKTRELAPRHYHWVASGTVDLLRNSRQVRVLAQAGLSYPVEHLRLK